jgi:MFS transporter, OFA family, oxalate/formate antiporter
VDSGAPQLPCDAASGPASPALRREQLIAVCAVFVGLAAGYPSSYAATATAFILPLTSEFGWGRTVPSLMYVSSMLGIAIGSIWLGNAIERFGAAPVVAFSGVCMGVIMGLLLSTMSGSPGIAVGLCFFAGALGAGTSVGAYLSILPNWFDQHLGRALAISIIGMSVGVTLMPALAARVIALHGWRSAYLTIATLQIPLTLATVLALRWLARRGRMPSNAAALSARAGMELSRALKTRAFWIMLVMIVFGSAGVFGISLHFFPLYVDRGVSSALLPTVAVAAGIGTLLGRLSSGLLLDHADVRIVAGATFSIGGAAIAWLALSGQIHLPIAIFLPPLLIGMALGAESDILTYMVRRFFGSRHCSAIYNRLLVGYYLGAVIGPLSLGWAFDHMRQSWPVIAGLAGSCLIAAMASLTLPVPPHDYAPR